MTRPRSGLIRTGVAWLVIAIGVVGIVRPSGAQTDIAFTAVAVASPVSVEVTSASLPLAQTIGFDLPGAQATLDSIGQSRAIAGAPNPGETVVALPGLLATIGLAYVPPYPLIVQTESPTTTDEAIDQGPISLRARSEADASTGEASFAAGPGVLSSTARASVVRAADGEVRAEASSVTSGVDLGPILRIGSVESHAAAVLGTDGEVRLDHDSRVAALVINGLPLSIGPDGIAFLDQTIPVPLDLASLLSGTGLSITYLEPELEPDGHGVLTSAIRIEQIVEGALPTPLTVTVTLGRARVRLSGQVVPPLPLPAASTPSIAPGPPPVASSGPSAASAPIAPPALAPSVAVAPPAGVISNVGSVARLELRQFDVLNLYLLLIVAGGALLSAGRLFRVVGVRDPWAT